MLIFVFCFSGLFIWPLNIQPHDGVCVLFLDTSNPQHYECVIARYLHDHITPDSKVHEANIGPIWGRQDPDGPHVGPMDFVIWDAH